MNDNQVLQIDPNSLTLPTEFTEPTKKPEDYTILIHSSPGIGKSNFLTTAPDPLIIATEPGLLGLRHKSVYVDSWELFCAYLGKIKQSPKSCKTIGIDTSNNAFRLAENFVCRKYRVDHPADLKFGKQGILNNEFHRVITKAAALPQGLILTSHSRKLYIDSPTGKYVQMVPDFSDRVLTLITGMVDLVLYLTIARAKDGNDYRVLYTRLNKYYMAKQRIKGVLLPPIIPLPNADTAYEDFAKIFRKALNEEPVDTGMNYNTEELRYSESDDESETSGETDAA